MHPTIDSGSPGYVPPPPPPTPPALAEANGYEAGRTVEAMSPEQQATLATEVEAMPVATREDFANNLAAKLDADQLQQLVPVFGQETLLAAVQTRSPASVRETFEQANGAAPAATPTVAPSGRSDEAQVAAAKADYADQVDGQGILSQHALGDLMTANAGDPAYLAELVGIAREDGVLEQAVSTMGGSLFEKQDGEYVVNNDNASFDADARREAFALSIGAAIDRGTMTEADLRTLATGGSGWVDVATRAGVGQVGVTDASQQAGWTLDDRVESYQGARDDVQKLDEELAGMLAEAGPMTGEQQAAFVNAFRTDPEHAPTYEGLTTATSALTSYVTSNRAAVLDAAVRDPEVAGLVRDALAGMAAGGRGEEAIALLTEINAGGETSALAQAFAGFDELSGQVLEDAASSAMTQLLERNNGDGSAAAAQFQSLMLGLVQAVPAYAGVKDFQLGNSFLKAANAGDVRAMQVYLQEFDGKSPMIRAFGAAGIVAGAVGAVNAGTNDDYVNMIGGFAQSGENAARMVAGTMTSVAAVGEAAQAGGRFAGFAAKLAPGLGLIANGASLVNSIDRAAEGNPGYAVAAFGDVLGILGSAIELTPAAPAGFVVSGIGAVISGLGSLAGEVISGNQRRDEIEGYLKDAGVDASIADEMANSGKQLFELADALELSPEQVQSLLVSHPDIGGAPGLAGAFTDFARANGISGDAVAGFADALSAERSDFAWDLMGVRGEAPDGAGEADSFYRDYIANAYPDAGALAQTAAPELFGEAADAREQAQRDYNQVSGSDMDFANLLKNEDSPHYRAEMMRLLAEGGDGRLEVFAEMISGYDDLWSGSVRDSVAAAVDLGTLSQSQADLILGYF
ncbi:MAG TPA: hypothetical protein VLK29_08775 [Luteimonas sp.]|nr:hypothetical protein [Luteimonas sp.]